LCFALPHSFGERATTATTRSTTTTTTAITAANSRVDSKTYSFTTTASSSSSSSSPSVAAATIAFPNCHPRLNHPPSSQTMAPSTTPKSPAKAKLSPVKLDPQRSAPANLTASSPPTKPDRALTKPPRALDSASPNTQKLVSKFDALTLTNTNTSNTNASGKSALGSPTKTVYHPSPTKENRGPGTSTKEVEKPQITLLPPLEEDYASPSGPLSEQAKKSLRSINALRGLTLDEIEIINKPHVKRLATVTQLCMSSPTSYSDCF
jgi:hypothetical protein